MYVLIFFGFGSDMYVLIQQKHQFSTIFFRIFV